MEVQPCFFNELTSVGLQVRGTDGAGSDICSNSALPAPGSRW